MKRYYMIGDFHQCLLWFASMDVNLLKIDIQACMTGSGLCSYDFSVYYYIFERIHIQIFFQCCYSFDVNIG